MLLSKPTDMCYKETVLYRWPNWCIVIKCTRLIYQTQNLPLSAGDYVFFYRQLSASVFCKCAREITKGDIYLLFRYYALCRIVDLAELCSRWCLIIVFFEGLNTVINFTVIEKRGLVYAYNNKVTNGHFHFKVINRFDCRLK